MSDDAPARPRSRREADTPTHPFTRTPAAVLAVPGSLPAPPRKRPFLLVLSGPRMGELIPVEGAGIVIGRDPNVQLTLLEEGVSRRHARVTVDGDAVHLIDLGSTNGTWIDGERITERVLGDGTRFQIGQTSVFKFAWHDPIEEQYQRQLLDTALRDGLTRAFNRRYFLDRLDAEVAFAGRHRAPLALLLLDLDRFTLINRVYGSAAGDAILLHTAAVLHGTIRSEDLLARQTEDTFAVLLRDTEIDGALRLGERLRCALAESRFEWPLEPTVADPHAPPAAAIIEVRCSIGAAAITPIEGASSLSLLASANAGLKRAKLEGRNRVAIDEKLVRLDP